MADPSPHGSLTMYDPNSCDLNNQNTLVSREERTAKLSEFYNTHVGKMLYLKHAKSGAIRPAVITPTGPFTRAGWVWCEHILFGMWRLASPEDVAKFKSDLEAKHRTAATAEAHRMADASGMVLKEMAQTAATIAAFSKIQPAPAPMVTPDPAPEPSPPERSAPTSMSDADIDARNNEAAPVAQPPARGRRKKKAPTA